MSPIAPYIDIGLRRPVATQRPSARPRSCTVCLVFLGLILLPCPAPAAPGSRQPRIIKQLERQLCNRSWQKVVEARQALLELDDAGRQPLIRGLEKRLKKLSRDRKKLEKWIANRHLRRLGKHTKSLKRAFDTYHDASAKMLRRAFDDELYAVPEKARTGWSAGKDHQPGQVAIEILVVECIHAYAVLEATLVTAMGGNKRAIRDCGGEHLFERHEPNGEVKDTAALPVQQYRLPPRDGRWIVLLQRLEANALTIKRVIDEEAQVGQWLRDLGQAATASQADVALHAAVYALAAGDYPRAAALRSHLSGVDSHFFDFLAKQVVNTVVDELLRDQEWDTLCAFDVRLTNDYRICIGLWPLIPNAKLLAAAAEHSQHQYETRKMSHYRESEPKMASPSLRAQAQGYPAGAAENVSSRSYAKAGVIWRWRTDAGHHRNLIRPEHRGVGLAAFKQRYATWNTGRVAEHPIEVLMEGRKVRRCVSPNQESVSGTCGSCRCLQ